MLQMNYKGDVIPEFRFAGLGWDPSFLRPPDPVFLDPVAQGVAGDA